MTYKSLETMINGCRLRIKKCLIPGLFTLIICCTNSTAPEKKVSIRFWYGAEQHFGKLGISQRWVNILGNVKAERGLRALHYTLNGEDSILLSVGQDGFRLANPGDFNIDLDTATLLEGKNSVRVIALDSAGFGAEEEVIGAAYFRCEPRGHCHTVARSRC